MRVRSRLAIAMSLVFAFFALGSDASARTVPQGFYGVAYDGVFADAPAERQLEQFDLMAESGVESIRLLFAWEVMQPVRRRKPNFKRMDVKVYLAALRGIEVLPTVLYAPYWGKASRCSSPHRHPTTARAASTPSTAAGWRRDRRGQPSRRPASCTHPDHLDPTKEHHHARIRND